MANETRVPDSPPKVIVTLNPREAANMIACLAGAISREPIGYSALGTPAEVTITEAGVDKYRLLFCVEHSVKAKGL